MYSPIYENVSDFIAPNIRYEGAVVNRYIFNGASDLNKFWLT